MGWNAEHIHANLDLIILGMHAKKNNPELQKALDLKIPVQSFPEFVFQQTRDKLRVVVSGSHGKTTITSMIMHMLKEQKIDFDYLVGAKLSGFERMVKISNAPIVVIEGDEYLSSALDRRSKFHWYKPSILLLTGIAWDHMNVFPTFDSYLQTFEKLIADNIDAKVIYFQDDKFNCVHFFYFPTKKPTLLRHLGSIGKTRIACMKAGTCMTKNTEPASSLPRTVRQKFQKSRIENL